MSIHSRLLLPENLNYAWIKTKSLLRMADGYVDRAEVAAFEIDLEQKLFEIHRQFEQGKYRLKQLRPLPRPKKISDDQPINRQYYHVAIEDQVAWIALVNAIGPDLDQKMMPWSYGNRLYRPAWYEKNDAGQSELEIGPYRHSSGHLYRRFQHSWPLFRRHVTLTARMMVRKTELNRDEMDTADQLAAAAAKGEKLVYFQNGWWHNAPKTDRKNELFHASIDLEKFYPNLKLEAVVDGLGLAGALAEPKMRDLVGSMLDFELDMSGMPSTSVENVEPKFVGGRVKGLPTGLFVSGFLANAAMLPIDQAVAEKISADRNIAHFRFVDDHTIIAYDFDTLCDWIIWYEELLKDTGIGATVNVDKYDPPELAKLIKLRKAGEANEEAQLEYRKALSMAMQETRIDGRNPTKLMTKTLAQVSEIATADIHILDDDDLVERLSMLEWLMLADIPEREIRPDTRASFAAGQIASLVPALIQEVESIIEKARRLAEHQKREPDAERSTVEDRQRYEAKTAELKQELNLLEKKQSDEESKLLKRCFALILQALREHPGKARLFYRIHQYCRITGHPGLKKIEEWLTDTRAEGQDSWADYYTALSLQIMASGLLLTVAQLPKLDSLRSDIKAAESHLEDIANLDIGTFVLPSDRETWFHAIGRREFGIALIQAAENLSQLPKYSRLADKFKALSRSFVPVRPDVPLKAWLMETGWSAGVWAHLAENTIGQEDEPTPAWKAFSSGFDFDHRLDLRAARRYPEHYPEAGWLRLLTSAQAMPEDDSAWLRQVIGGNRERSYQAQESTKPTFARAARSLQTVSENQLSLVEWTSQLIECSPFDPRRSEWTALEIVRKLLNDALTLGPKHDALDFLHPDNVLLPIKWISEFKGRSGSSLLGWEEWRNFINEDGQDKVELRATDCCIRDYRFSSSSNFGLPFSPDEKRLTAIGRILLGLLRQNYTAPKVWNVRGNELIYPLPRARWFGDLAISSSTTQLLDACLAARPAESRIITRQPDLFAWISGELPNDVTYDPVPIFNLNDLIERVSEAQQVLLENQLSVSANQPRQLIPFRIADFAVGTDDTQPNNEAGGGDAE
ncbi:RNA-directed DNA polymerase [uncultured Sulfitobacter sp.]|uniref:RNA-directed DNA polymerase n=1 Tax=uncultured Sulfitobacter sp. TaxID=191468 RepID=UPI0026242A97|nr:RNA-directed DNA polymerase [uncultured Sulfitobacter sp.]